MKKIILSSAVAKTVFCQNRRSLLQEESETVMDKKTNFQSFLFFSSVLLGILGVIFLGGCGFRHVLKPSGKTETVNRSVKIFHAISFHGYGNLTLNQGNKEKLSITTDTAILPFIKTNVQNGVLVIGFKHKMGLMLIGNPKIQFNLTVKKLNKLTISGAARAEAPSLKLKNFEIESTGSSEVKIGDLSCDHLKVNLPGMGSIELAGRVSRAVFTVSGAGNIQADNLQTKTMTVNISGAGAVSLSGRTDNEILDLSGMGSIHAEKFKTQNAEIKISGVGKATLWAMRSLDVKITGTGEVDYYGPAKVEKSISGAGEIKRLGLSPSQGKTTP